MSFEKQEIVFVTHNKGKIATAQKYFTKNQLEFKIYEYELEEPRSDDLRTIAESKVKQAFKLVNKPCIALDTGFYINSLNGFPKAFVNFALDTIGVDGILKLMDGVEDRSCHFGECLAYYDGAYLQFFECKIPGIISFEKLGKDTDVKWSDLWYIFIPQGYDLTLAQMDDDMRNERQRKMAKESIEMFSIWYKQRLK